MSLKNQDLRCGNYLKKNKEGNMSLICSLLSQAEHELRVAQTEFDRQAEVTRLLLEGISSTHVNHLRCLHEFVEAQAAYYKQCDFHMKELQKELSSCDENVLPNAFVLSSTHPSAPASEGSPLETDTLKIEEVQAPATGTRKAKVLYDYDAADSSELSLLADEVMVSVVGVMHAVIPARFQS
ncbi:endophilin-B2-like [Notothenia coriiceps]|uniref:Endophilin-B2-like n=1 Tax=Notothenia coriiceps TaxID=8208 RepID=A0A6I9PV91_9TELE|nr:PREDICTED: endophilin-B2-like [Notothenia coriiceps]